MLYLKSSRPKVIFAVTLVCYPHSSSSARRAVSRDSDCFHVIIVNENITALVHSLLGLRRLRVHIGRVVLSRQRGVRLLHSPVNLLRRERSSALVPSAMLPAMDCWLLRWICGLLRSGASMAARPGGGCDDDVPCGSGTSVVRIGGQRFANERGCGGINCLRSLHLNDRVRPHLSYD